MIEKIKMSLPSKAWPYYTTRLCVCRHDLAINPELLAAWLRCDQLLKEHRAKGIVDHKDRNSLNDSPDNLRYVTASQSLANRGKIKTRNGIKTTSRFIGVSKLKNVHGKRGWSGFYKSKGKIFRRYFSLEEDAARWRDSMAIKHMGEFACLNFQQHKAWSIR